MHALSRGPHVSVSFHLKALAQPQLSRTTSHNVSNNTQMMWFKWLWYWTCCSAFLKILLKSLLLVCVCVQTGMQACVFLSLCICLCAFLSLWCLAVQTLIEVIVVWLTGGLPWGRVMHHSTETTRNQDHPPAWEESQTKTKSPQLQKHSPVWA